MRALGIAVVLLLAGCSGGGQTVDTPVPQSAPPNSAPGTPSGTTLFTGTGTGMGATAPFSASGPFMTLAYQYGPCDSGVVFVVSVVGTIAANSALEHPVVSGLEATSGSGSTPIYLNSQPGPFHLEVNSTCPWSLTVTGQP